MKKNKEKLERLPIWLQRKQLLHKNSLEVKKLLRRQHLKTVCESAKCPNISECFKKPTATFMILGDICTRACKFCNVTSGKPGFLDTEEPKNVALSVQELKLKHVVITSVDRDDLPDLGAEQFVKTIREIRKIMPKSTTIEILTPDFQGKKEVIDLLLNEDYDIFNHNLETVPSLFKEITPKSDYHTSLHLLRYMKLNSGKITKTGIMVGLGETDEELYELMKDSINHKVDALTIGQYLRPSKKHYPVKRYVTPELFDNYKDNALKFGFKYVASAPYVRSSYNAEELINSLS